MSLDTSWFGEAGRTFIVLSFFVAGLYNLVASTAQIGRLKSFNVPFPAFAFWLGMTVLFVGCLMIVARWHPRVGAVLLIGFTIAATLIYHRFWTKGDPGQRLMSRITFVGNIAIVGGLLLVAQQ